MSKIEPNVHDGISWCSESCRSHDGKRCKIIGGEPETVCTPDNQRLARENEQFAAAFGEIAKIVLPEAEQPAAGASVPRRFVWFFNQEEVSYSGFPWTFDLLSVPRELSQAVNEEPALEEFLRHAEVGDIFPVYKKGAVMRVRRDYGNEP